MGQSIISKINVGVNTKREKHNLSCQTSTTANFGFMQPTFCREMVPNSKFVLNSVESLCFLAPVSLPCFGKITMRHYHAFVPYSSIYFPFDSFLSRTPYTNTNGTMFNVNRLPTFTIRDFIKYIMNYYTKWTDVYDNHIFKAYDTSTTRIATALGHYGSNTLEYEDDAVKKVVVSQEALDAMSYDMIISDTSAHSAYRTKILYTPVFRRLVKVFTGLGYNFSPWSNVELNPLKLIAYYKAYYNYFAVQRETNYFATDAYKLSVILSNENGKTWSQWSTEAKRYFCGMLYDIAQASYILPADYFSMGNLTINESVNPSASINLNSFNDISNPDMYENAQASNVAVSYQDSSEGIVAVNMAQRLFNYVQKNTVVGKSVRKFLQAHFDVTDEHDNIHEEVVKIGSNVVPLKIETLYSLADDSANGGLTVGDYKGKGLGYKKDNGFDYEAKQFGVWITLSCIVPEAGYTQGTLKENTFYYPEDFYTPEFDALGFEVLSKYELINDHAHELISSIDPTEGWNLVPRYSSYKVGRDILNGELALPSSKLNNAGFTLTRQFHYNGQSIYPVQDPEQFRNVQVGSNNLYRIFDDISQDEDHFIFHIVFDMLGVLPMKSLSNSYDTLDDSDKVVSFNKA